MTTEQLTIKVNELLANDKKFIQDLITKAVNSGCLDIEGAENNYRLPKNLLSAIYTEMARQYAPPSESRKDKANIKNIYMHL